MIAAIIKEITIQKLFLADKQVSSVYFGGGTPSLLASDRLSLLMDALHQNFSISGNAEITLEANPDDVNKKKVNDWQTLGINRISLGVQSFDDAVLAALNRSHNASQAENSLSMLQDSGLSNISIDLIYGIPNQSLAQWQYNLEKAVGRNIPHISSYALTIEDKTAFGRWKSTGKLNPVSDEAYEQEYLMLCEYLNKAGYEHYEVSNFAKPEFRSRHNSSYWQQHTYLGLGPGAHSFNGTDRFFNVSNNASYIRSLRNGQIPSTRDKLSERDRYNEYLLTCLRTSDGLFLRRVLERFNVNIREIHKSFLEKAIHEGLMTLASDRLILSEKGLFISDSIIIELMQD